jgi:hypothetical protein
MQIAEVAKLEAQSGKEQEGVPQGERKVNHQVR